MTIQIAKTKKGETAMLTRKELYDLVWTRPMTSLAPKFGMSDVALRKHCKKHNIPTPPLGHWAKVAHGKATRQPPLPRVGAESEDIVYVDRVPEPTAATTPLIPDTSLLDDLRTQFDHAGGEEDPIPKPVRSLVASLK